MAWTKINARASQRNYGPVEVHARIRSQQLIFPSRFAGVLGLREGLHQVYLDTEEQLIGLKPIEQDDPQYAGARLRKVAESSYQLMSASMTRAMGLSDYASFMCKAYRQGDMIVVNLKEVIEEPRGPATAVA